MKKIISILVASAFLSGCAAIPKTKHGKKRFGFTVGGVAAGAAVGALSAPDDERPAFHGVAWGLGVGFVVKLIVDYIWGDHHELADTKKEFQDYKEKNDFIKIDERLGYMTDTKDGQKVRVIYEVHKGRKVFPVSDTEKYIAEKYLKARPLTENEKLKESKK